jgi:hypothetical protein
VVPDKSIEVIVGDPKTVFVVEGSEIVGRVVVVTVSSATIDSLSGIVVEVVVVVVVVIVSDEPEFKFSSSSVNSVVIGRDLLL